MSQTPPSIPPPTPERGPRAVANTAFLLGSSFLAKVFGGLLVIVVAHLTDTETTGLFNLVMIYLTLFKFFGEMGLSGFVIREVGRYPERAQEYLSNASALSLGLGGLFAGLMAATYWLVQINLGDQPPASLSLIGFAAGSLVIMVVVAMISAVFSGLEEMGIPALWTVVMRIATTVLGVLSILLGHGLAGVFAGQLAAAAMQLGGLWRGLRQRGLRLLGSVHWRKMAGMLREASPFAVLGALSLIYMRADAIIISLYSPGREVEVAYYSNVYFYFEFLVQIPVGIAVAMMPMMSQAYVYERERMWGQYRMAVQFQAFLGVPLMVFSSIKGTEIMTAIFGADYAVAGAIMPMMAVSLFTVFLSMPALNIIKNTQFIWHLALYLALVTVLSIGLNLLFVPQYGFVAAAWICMGTKLLDVLFYSLLLRIIAGGPIGLPRACMKPFASGLGTGAAIWALPELHPIAVFLVAAPVYAGLYWSLGGFTHEEREFFGKLASKMRSRLGNAGVS